jgi:ketosteroid isomerase-like protein
MRLCQLELLAALALLAFAAWPVVAQPPERNPKEEAALLKNAEAFVEAFHKGDATALAAFWTTDGDYTDQTGRRMNGRDAIEKAFKEYFADNKGMKLRIDIGALRS